MSKRTKKLAIWSFTCLFVVVLVGAAVGTAIAGMGGGAVGMYDSGCKACHGSQPGTAGQVVINGQSSMTVGQKQTFTVTLIGVPPGPAGGIDAAVVEQYNGQDATYPDGSDKKADGLAAGVNTQYKAEVKEITHAAPIALTPLNGRVWTFDWTPPAPGSYKVKVVAVAANGNGRPDGDGNATMPKQLADGWYLGELAITVQ